MNAAPDVKKAPMAAAPLKYRRDGEVDWGSMWDTFCGLAQDGGPPHRESLLRGPAQANADDIAYQRASQEIIRGVAEVSTLVARPAEPGWLRVACESPKMAQWLAAAIVEAETLLAARAKLTGLLSQQTASLPSLLRAKVELENNVSHDNRLLKLRSPLLGLGMT